MSQVRRRRLLRETWRCHDELVAEAARLAREGVGLTEAARRLDYPRESLRVLAERYDLAFPRKGAGNPGARPRLAAGIPVEVAGLYRDATHPLDRPLSPLALEALKRPWV